MTGRLLYLYSEKQTLRINNQHVFENVLQDVVTTV